MNRDDCKKALATDSGSVTYYDITQLGDRLMIKQYYENETENAIKNALGSQFLNSLGQLPSGKWSAS